MNFAGFLSAVREIPLLRFPSTHRRTSHSGDGDAAAPSAGSALMRRRKYCPCRHSCSSHCLEDLCSSHFARGVTFAQLDDVGAAAVAEFDGSWGVLGEKNDDTAFTVVCGVGRKYAKTKRESKP